MPTRLTADAIQLLPFVFTEIKELEVEERFAFVVDSTVACLDAIVGDMKCGERFELTF